MKRLSLLPGTSQDRSAGARRSLENIPVSGSRAASALREKTLLSIKGMLFSSCSHPQKEPGGVLGSGEGVGVWKDGTNLLQPEPVDGAGVTLVVAVGL